MFARIVGALPARSASEGTISLLGSCDRLPRRTAPAVRRAAALPRCTGRVGLRLDRVRAQPNTRAHGGARARQRAVEQRDTAEMASGACVCYAVAAAVAQVIGWAVQYTLAARSRAGVLYTMRVGRGVVQGPARWRVSGHRSRYPPAHPFCPPGARGAGPRAPNHTVTLRPTRTGRARRPVHREHGWTSASSSHRSGAPAPHQSRRVGGRLLTTGYT